MVISAGYPEEVRETAIKDGRRNYVRPRRPYDTDTWDALRLVEYRVASSGPAIRLRLVEA